MRFAEMIVMGAAVVLTACKATETYVETQSSSPSEAMTQTACDAIAITSDDRARILKKADAYLNSMPSTVTADRAERSAGGPNDFYSEGDYWWPVPGQPNAPYERRDGQSNPDNFVAHRLSMIRLSDIQGSLASAYRLTNDQKYADAALTHLKAWFVTDETRMTPSLLYAQAIKGRHTGRSIGVIDTLHLVETARAAKILGEAGAIPTEDYTAIKSWFSDYATWMNTHPYGVKERDWHNNHAIAWGLQVAAFSDLTGDKALSDLVRDQFKSVYLPNQMDVDGSFTKELARTKPYGYSLFVIDLMGGIAQILSTPEDSLWTYTTDAGQNMEQGLDFITPYIVDKTSWPYAQDVAFWNEWPARHLSLAFASDALGDCRYYDAVKDLPTDSDVYEVTRNMPLRHPILWMD